MGNRPGLPDQLFRLGRVMGVLGLDVESDQDLPDSRGWFSSRDLLAKIKGDATAENGHNPNCQEVADCFDGTMLDSIPSYHQ